MVPTGGQRKEKARPSGFARRLLAEWRRRGWAVRGERVVAAVSGGADSLALLLGLEELTRAGLLGVGVTAAHLDHGLRGERGLEDALWVEERARGLGFEVVTGRASVGGRAGRGRDNLEQAARRARYEFLAETAVRIGAAAVLVAHTLDDQAETVLLRLLRGSGADGLSGMRHERPLAGGLGASLRRPLLAWARRADTEGYCRVRGAEPRRDEMNDDEGFARVRVRRRLLPLLETFNPRAAEALARAADLLRDDAAALDKAAARLLEDACAARPESAESAGGEGKAEARPLSVAVLAAAEASPRRRALRLWLARGRGDLRRVELAHVLAVEKLLEAGRGGRVAELPGGARVERRRGLLLFLGERG